MGGYSPRLEVLGETCPGIGGTDDPPDIRLWLDRFGSGQLLLGAMARPHTHIFCYYIHIKSICVASGYYSKQSQKHTADTLFIRARM